MFLGSQDQKIDCAERSSGSVEQPLTGKHGNAIPSTTCLETFDWIARSTDLPPDVRDVDPAESRLPGSQSGGADPYKHHQQIARHGTSVPGMPPLLVYEGSIGVLDAPAERAHAPERTPLARRG